MHGLLLTLALAASGEPLSTEQIAQIQHEQEKAFSKLEADNGNRPPSELTSEERRQAVEARNRAAQEVLSRHKVDPKEFARREAKMGRAERAEVERQRKALEEADKKAEAEAKGAEEALPADQVIVEEAPKQEEPPPRRRSPSRRRRR